MICTLCPRNCGALRDSTHGEGFCRLPETMTIARIAPHLWEEPPISGTRGTGAVFFSGCTLRCAYCQNREISRDNAGRPFTPAQLAEAMKKLEDMGMHTISFITATPFIPQILQALDIYRPAVPLVWNTSGYETVETLKMLDGIIDVYLPDLKHRSERMGQLCAKAPDYFERASAAITEMVRQTGSPVLDENGIIRRGTIIRHLILPGLTGESMQLLSWVKETFGDEIPVSLMHQYTPMDSGIPGLDRKITEREYLRVKNFMMDLDLPGFEQEDASASGDFVPAFNRDESFI